MHHLSKWEGSKHTNNNRDTQRRWATTKYILVQCHISEVGIFYRNLKVCIRNMFLHDFWSSIDMIYASCRSWKSWNTYSGSDENLERAQTDQFHCKEKG